MPTFPIQIDATKLFITNFIIPNLPTPWTDSRTVQTLQLAPQTYSFQIGAGFYCDFTFTVTPQGTVTYDPAYSTFLSGAGTPKLVLNGFPVTLDARYMPGIGLTWCGDFPKTDEWISLRTYRMLPCSYYRVAQGSGVTCDFHFQIDLHGRVQYETVLDAATGGPLQGLNTTPLTFLGFPIIIDARKENATGVALQPVTWGVPFAYNSVLFLNLLPAHGFQLQFESGIVTKGGFDMDGKGAITLHPVALDFLSLDTFHGLTRLTVKHIVLPPLPKITVPST